MKGSQYSVIKLVESVNFIANINKLLKGCQAEVTVYDNWMPKSLRYDKEAELKDFLKYNFNLKISSDILKWWLSAETTSARTPNWDLISTCTVNEKRGVLLVEAKAHWDELDKESNGKSISQGNVEIKWTS